MSIVDVFRALRRLVTRGRAALGDRRAAGRAVLNDLLAAWDREITARERFRRGRQLDENNASRPGVLAKAEDIVRAASRDLDRASYIWGRLLISCSVDYDTWTALEEATRNAQEIDEAIRRAIKSGDYGEVESLFDTAMEQKLTAIRLAKSYLGSLSSRASGVQEAPASDPSG